MKIGLKIQLFCVSSPFDCQSEMQLILRNIVVASIGGRILVHRIAEAQCGERN